MVYYTIDIGVLKEIVLFDFNPFYVILLHIFMLYNSS